MGSLRAIRIHDGERLLRLVAAGTASALLTSTFYTKSHPNRNDDAWRTRWTTTCEQAAAPSEPTLPSSRPSWIRRSLAFLRVASLPEPRLLFPGDPAFRMDPGLLKKRQQDEVEMQTMIRSALQAQKGRNPKALQDLNDKCLELAYGKGVTLKHRQDFVHRHGCTAWTEEVLDAIVELGKDRGVVEIGAGNGQWARALMERYTHKNKSFPKKKFDFVLAYDDKSELPLDQQIFTKKTKIHHDFFYDKVQQCGTDFSNVLRRFECRGRILMLVYPPPGSMAIDAVQQYTSASERNDTVIFVGEGRGGANASDALFDLFENGEWVLVSTIRVVALGSKGYEKLFVLRRQVHSN